MNIWNSSRGAILVLAVIFAMPADARTPLQSRLEAMMQEASPGARFGMVVTDEEGREVVAIAPDQRFIPASNTKMFTTAAAFATLGNVGGPDSSGAAVRLDTDCRPVPDVILEGHGDARLSSAADCVANCLATLAEAVAARTLMVGDVIGDDSLFPDERWSPGMSWNNIHTRSGTAISALTLDDNELHLRVEPTSAGQAPKVEFLPYYILENRAVTIAAGKTSLSFDRLPGSRIVRLNGTIAAGSKAELIRLGIDDPAEYAAWRFKSMLEERGVQVKGKVATRHRLLTPADDPKVRKEAPPARPSRPPVLAKLTPPPALEDIAIINKQSQNVHAELMLRRVGLERGTGSIADGVAAVNSMLEEAGVPRVAFDFADGSGMSTYNRVAPRGVVRFLRWVSSQPWGASWRETLPVAGMDGTLTNRFRGTPLEKRLFAKTGSLNATNGLAGYMTARSGRTLTFSVYANDVPQDASATKAIDAALQLVAEEN